MDPIKSIGHILEGNEERDCIHIAILPAIAAETLHRGREVGLVYGTTNQVKSMARVYGLPAIGIVDPFLKEYSVEQGQRCWVFLFPGTVSGMRHDWTLPAIDNPQVPKSESEEWLHRFANKWNFDYDEMINAASDPGGAYVVARGIDLHGADELAPGDEQLFWQHMEALTGQTFDAAHRNEFGWSCTC